MPHIFDSAFSASTITAPLRWIGLFLLCFLPATAGAQSSPPVPDAPLIAGQPVQKPIKVDESHGYSLRVEKDYFVHVIVQSRRFDVALTLFGPDGKQIAQSQDYDGDVGIERLVFIVDEPQLLRFEVSGVRKLGGDGGGSYTIQLKALRLAQKNDRDLAAAESLWREARTLPRNTEDSRREAVAKLKPAVELFLALGEFERAADSYSFLAKNCHGEHSKALMYYEQALELYKKAGNRQREALLLNNIGIGHSQSGDFEKALDYFTRSWEIRHALGLRTLESGSLNQIGMVYYRLGDPQRALTYHLQSLPIAMTFGPKRAQVVLLGFIGADYYKMEQYSQALSYFNQSLQMARQFSPTIRQISGLRNVGYCQLKLGKTEEALQAFNEALSLERTFNNAYERGNLFAGLGEAYYKLNEPNKAQEYLTQSFPLFQITEDRLGEPNAHYWLARVEMNQGKLDEALAEIEKTVSLVERLRSNLASPELRTLYFASVERYYESYLEILWQLHQKHPESGFDDKALQISERCRARSLIELLTETRIDIRQGVSAELLARERELQRQLNAKADAQLSLLGDEEPGEQSASSSKEIETLTNALQDVRAEIHQQSPHYAALTQPRTLSVKEIQEHLDADTLLLEYKLGEQRSFLWAVGRTEIQAYELPGRAQIEPLAQRVYQLLVARKTPAPDEKEYGEAAEKLSRLLLGPIASTLKSRRLIIVSDGALQYLPFAALPSPSDAGQETKVSASQSRPLIMDHEIVNLPSASVIAVLRQETATRKPAPKAVAVFADPVFARNDTRVAAAKRGATTERGHASGLDDKSPEKEERKEADGPSITRLPFSRREASAILSVAAANETYAALDFEANRANATSPALLQYRIVHFATHGWMNNTRPELSGVVLSLVNQKGQLQDGVLRLHEIYNLQLNADLVVLSACQSALGKDVRGEGLIGLTRGFMYAGAPRVAASLWKVDDAATADLMAHFYRFMLKEKLSPAASLRAAQLELIKQKRWHAPYFWAGFVLQGEWR